MGFQSSKVTGRKKPLTARPKAVGRFSGRRLMIVQPIAQPALRVPEVAGRFGQGQEGRAHGRPRHGSLVRRSTTPR